MKAVSRVDVIKGGETSILKFLQDSDDGYRGFGEVYFSRIGKGVDRGWKIHSEATCNIMVPFGLVRFCVARYDFSEWLFVELGGEPQERLTIEPKTWYRFIGNSSDVSIIANVLDIKHGDEQLDEEQSRLMLNKPKVEVIWSNKAIKHPMSWK